MQKPGSHFGLPGETQTLGELNAAPLQCGYSDTDFGTVYPEEYGSGRVRARTFVLLEPNPRAFTGPAYLAYRQSARSHRS
jgi:hypothetical protein